MKRRAHGWTGRKGKCQQSRSPPTFIIERIVRRCDGASHTTLCTRRAMETINRRSEAHTHTQSAAYIRSVAPHSASWSRRHHRCKAPLTRRRIERKFSGSPNDGGRLSGAYTTSCTRRAQRQRSPPTTCYTLLALVVYDSIPCRSLDVLSVSFFFSPSKSVGPKRGERNQNRAPR